MTTLPRRLWLSSLPSPVMTRSGTGGQPVKIRQIQHRLDAHLQPRAEKGGAACAKSLPLRRRRGGPAGKSQISLDDLRQMPQPVIQQAHRLPVSALLGTEDGCRAGFARTEGYRCRTWR